MLNIEDITFISCIENKSNHRFEEELKVFINSYKKNNILKHLIIQPSEYDITSHSKKFIKDNNISFKKKILNNIQKNRSINYTNVPIVLEYSIDLVDTDYICFMDLDVIFFDNISNIFKPTDKCVLTLLEPEEDLINSYNLYFKKYYKIELEKTVNTRFIFSNKNHFFLRNIKKLPLNC